MKQVAAKSGQILTGILAAVPPSTNLTGIGVKGRSMSFCLAQMLAMTRWLEIDPSSII